MMTKDEAEVILGQLIIECMRRYGPDDSFVDEVRKLAADTANSIEMGTEPIEAMHLLIEEFSRRGDRIKAMAERKKVAH